MSKVIITFCEGDHDIAILSKLLSIHGFLPYRKKVKDFPKPFDNFYMNILSKNSIEDSEFKFQRPNKYIPFVVFSKKDVLVIFHNLGGDGHIQSGETASIIERYVELNEEALRKVEKYDEIDFRFLYFLDADDIGVDGRLREVADLLQLESIEHYEIKSKDSFEVGCYVFHDKKNASKCGKLEDLLLDLMIPNNDEIFINSANFIDNYEPTLLNRQKEYICSTDGRYRGSVQFKKEKSIISIAGQLQFSGVNNSVIIARSDYIRASDIEGSSCCKDIMKLFDIS